MKSLIELIFILIIEAISIIFWIGIIIFIVYVFF